MRERPAPVPDRDSAGWWGAAGPGRVRRPALRVLRHPPLPAEGLLVPPVTERARTGRRSQPEGDGGERIVNHQAFTPGGAEPYLVVMVRLAAVPSCFVYGNWRGAHEPRGGSPSSPPRRRSSTGCTAPAARSSIVDNPSEMPPPARSSTSRSRSSRSPSSRPPTTPARSWSCARPAGARCRSSSTCRPSGSSCIYRMPLAEVVIDFFDQMKSRTQGYASLDYEPAGYERVRPGEGRHPAQRRAGRRLQHDRAPRQGRRVRPAHDREAARS